MYPCEPRGQKTRCSAGNYWPKRKSLAQKEIQLHGVEDHLKQAFDLHLVDGDARAFVPLDSRRGL